jgi:hypothetical protein
MFLFANKSFTQNVRVNYDIAVFFIEDAVPECTPQLRNFFPSGGGGF